MRVLFVGDTHGNVDWWSRSVAPTIVREEPDLVIQVGDFGWWPHAVAFIDVVRSSPVPVWFIDGNHEHWPSLTKAVARTPPSRDGTVPMGGNLAYVPRATVITLGGCRVLFCGGAHSIDRALRTPSLDWWPDEAVTDADVEACAAHGPVDILVTHDAPDRWAVPGITDDKPMPSAWRSELAACKFGRRQLSRILDAARPRLAIHGHLHVGYTLELERGDDDHDLDVIGLACDGMDAATTLVEIDDDRPTVRLLR